MKKIISAGVICLLVLSLILSDHLITAWAQSSPEGAMEVAETVESSTLQASGIDLDQIATEIFPDQKVVDVNISIDPDVYQDMIANATAEEFVLADITYNGYTLKNIAIRPKGNSSLRDVAQSGDDRFSFKLDLDKYVTGQNLFGLTRLNLNNIFSDPSYMAEYLGYEMLKSIDAPTPDTTYVALHINGAYFGLYLAVEEVDEAFLLTEFGNFDGELYKPDMGVGADLAYISDNVADYTGIFPENDDRVTDDHFINLVKTIHGIVEAGGETSEYQLSAVMNVDSFLQYLAMSTVTVHMDTIQSGMNHNYFLYYNTDTGLYEWVSWDLNMIFNGFPGSTLTDGEATAFLIDEPVIGKMSAYPLVQAVMTNPAYVEAYHGYLEDIVTGFLSDQAIENTVMETYALIDSYVRADPSAFVAYDQFKESLFGTSSPTEDLSILSFATMRVDNVLGQLSGDIASTNEGQGNAGTGKGMGGGQGGQNGQMGPPPEGGDGKGMKPQQTMGENADGQAMAADQRQKPMGGPRDEAVNKVTGPTGFAISQEEAILVGVGLLVMIASALVMWRRKSLRI